MDPLVTWPLFGCSCVTEMRLPIIPVLYVLVFSAICVPSGLAFADSPVVFQARLVSASLKVFPDSDMAGLGDEKPFRIVGVRNEFAPFQVAVSAPKGVSGVSIIVSKLVGPKGTIDVPPQSLLLVENVLVKTHSIPVAESEGPPLARLWPDPLPPLTPFTIREGETRAAWVDLFIPPPVEPGVYKGSVSVSSADGRSVELPFEIDVRNVTLSTVPSLRTAVGNVALPSCSEKTHHIAPGSPEYRKLAERYYWFLVDHRLSPYQIPVSVYDDEAHRFLDDPRVTSFLAPTGWDTGNDAVIWNDAEMTRIKKRLRETGWIDKALFYVIDEPDEEAFPDLAKVGKRLHSVDRHLRYLMTPHSSKLLSRKDVLDEAKIDIWVPLVTLMSRSKERTFLLDEKKKGKELWWYTCVVPKWKGMNYFIDEAATAPRLHPWMSLLYGNTGILYWAADNWMKVDCDPWSEPETFPTGNGDGSLLYPGRDFPGPVASIRLKMLREGLEDHELLALLGSRLRDAAKKIGRRAGSYDQKVRLFEHALALVTTEGRAMGPNGDAPYLTHLTQDYREIEKRRKLIIGEIEELSGPPILLVRTDPRDGETTDQDIAIIQGFTEKRTVMKVNGISVPVRRRTFETLVPLVPGVNTITVTAANSDGRTRTTTRLITKR
jgi:hypothetical protein